MKNQRVLVDCHVWVETGLSSCVWCLIACHLFCCSFAVVPVLTSPCKGLTGTQRFTRWSKRTRSPVQHLVSQTPLKCCRKSWRLMRKVRSSAFLMRFFFFLNLYVEKGLGRKLEKQRLSECLYQQLGSYVFVFRGSPAVSWEAFPQRPKTKYICWRSQQTPHLWEMWNKHCVSPGVTCAQYSNVWFPSEGYIHSALM